MPIQPPSHWLFQLANCLLFVSYLSNNILALRLLLAAASLCFCLWGALILNISVDTTIYNAIFATINLTHAVIIIRHMLPVELPTQLQRLYTDWSAQLKLSRRDFNILTKVPAKFNPVGETCDKDSADASAAEQPIIRLLQDGQPFIVAGARTKALSILLTGRMIVYKRHVDGSNVYVHSIQPHDIIDSPEYAARDVHLNPVCTVTIVAAPNSVYSPSNTESVTNDSNTIQPASRQHCSYLSIPYEHIDNLRNTHPHIHSMIDALVGRDLTHKLRYMGLRLSGVIECAEQEEGVVRLDDHRHIVSETSLAVIKHDIYMDNDWITTDKSENDFNNNDENTTDIDDDNDSGFGYGSFQKLNIQTPHRSQSLATLSA